MTVETLTELWQGHPRELQDIKSTSDHFNGVRLRYANFFDQLGGAFDGDWSAEDVDIAVLTFPVMASKGEADAAMRLLLEDHGHYSVARKPRIGEDALLVIDEFSALDGGVDTAINLAERVRDVGVQVIVAAQSVEGLGDARQANRLISSSAGGVIIHRTATPEPLLRLAGMVRDIEQSWAFNQYGPMGHSQVRMTERYRIDPEQVRAAATGEAWVIHGGRAVHLLVFRAPDGRDGSRS